MDDRDLKRSLNTYNGVVNADEIEPMDLPEDGQAKRDDKETTWDDNEDLTKSVMKRKFAEDETTPMTWPGSQPCTECEND